ALPAHDLLRLAALVADLLPALGPAGVSVLDLPHAGVPEQRLALAVALDAHRDRREGGGAQLRRAPRLAVVGPHARQEVVPQLRGRVVLAYGPLELALRVAADRRPAGAAADLLRQHLVTLVENVPAVLVLLAGLALREADRPQVAADDLVDGVVVDHRRH